MPLITINGNSLDPEVQTPVLSGLGLRADDASKSDYILVQTDAPLSVEQKNELVNLGLVMHKYVSLNTYLYGFKGTNLNAIRALPFVTWADVYLQQFKVAATLKPAPRAGVVGPILPTM